MKLRPNTHLTKSGRWLRRLCPSPTLLAFLIPFIGMLCVLLIGQYEPFGNDRALLYSDEYHQYFPFFLAFRKALRSGNSLLYSWNVGMGLDYLGLISYYLASPLNLLSVLVPESLTLEYFALLSPIKLGLAGAFFAIFLKKTCGKDDWSISFFGAFYALCAWSLGYQWNVMWLDTFALLPLVALGTVLLLRDKKPALYTVTLFLSIFANYYIGFFTCIFVLLLFFCYEICRFPGFKRLFLDFCRIGVFTVLAIGMTAVLELPALAALQNTQSSVNSFPETFDLNMVDKDLCTAAYNAWEAFKAAKADGAGISELLGLWFDAFWKSFPPILDGMRQVAGNMGGGLHPTFKEGLPNLHCGVATIMLAFLFLTGKGIKLRDKICSVLLLIFFMVSFVIRQLDYIWHGFHFTNMIPYRFSFLFSFVLLYMAYRAWLQRRSFNLWQMIISALLSFAIIMCSNEWDDPVYLVYNLTFLGVYLVLSLGAVVEQKLFVRAHTGYVMPEELPETSAEIAAEDPEETGGEAFPAEAQEETGDEAIHSEAPDETEADDCSTEASEETVDAESCDPDAPEVIPAPVPVLMGPNEEQLEAHARLRDRIVAAVVFTAMSMELILSLISFGVRFSYTNITNYPKGTEHAASMIRYLDQREKGSDFFRTEVTHSQTLNDGALNGYNGISTFTSSANVRITEFMKFLGYGAKNTYNRYCFEEASPVANLFLNLKYMIERDGDLEENSYFDLIHTYGDVSLLENNAYLPLGFLAESQLKDSSLDQLTEYSGSNAFLKQNYLFKLATGLDEPVWSVLSGSRLNTNGSKSLTIKKAAKTGYTSYSTKDRAATLRYTYTMDDTGFLCLDLNMTQRNSYKVYKNDQELFSESMSLPQMIAVSEVEPGDKIIIDITCKKETEGVVLIRAGLLNDEVFRQGYDILSASTLDLTSFSNTAIEGTIDCDRDGLMYTSVPYDGNWIAEVDGKEVEPVLVADAMMALELTEGTHTITFRYHNAAFTVGAAVSLGCLAVFLTIMIVPRLLPKKEPPQPEQPTE